MRKIEFIDYLKADYVNTALIINYNDQKDLIISATLHSNSFGVITYENELVEVHIWEEEDQIRDISDLTKRYTTILLNGVSNDNKIRQNILNDVNKLVENSNITTKDKSIINKLFSLLSV
jgi:hypothetical protein